MGVKTSELSILVRARDRATKTYQKIKRGTADLSAYTRRKFDAIKKTVFSLKGAFVALAGAAVLGKLAKSFIRTGADLENMRTTLAATLGSVKEANLLFDDLAKYAGKVPFQLDEIVQTATALSGTFTGGRQEIMKFMPLIGDLAAYAKSLGINFDAAGMQIQRMFSAGAASADLFREKGIQSMLGFQYGVQYTAKETRDIVIKAWEDTNSKFRGLADKLSATWDGKVSMMWDKWWQFKKDVMEAGVMEYLKKGMDLLTGEMGGLKDIVPKAARAIIDCMETGSKAVTGLIDTYKLLTYAIKESGVAALASNLIAEDSDITWENFKRGVQSLLGPADELTRTILHQAKLSTKAKEEAATPLTYTWWDDLKAGLRDVAHVTEDITNSFEKLREEMEKTKVVPWREKIKEGINELNDLYGGERHQLKLNMDLYEKAAGSLGAYGVSQTKLLEAIGNTEDALEKEALAWDLADAAMEKYFNEVTGKKGKDMIQWQQDLRDAFEATANVLFDYTNRAIDEALDKGVKWKNLLQDITAELGKMAVQMAFQIAMRGVMTALGGSSFARGGVIQGGVKGLIPAYAGGVVLPPNKPHIAIVGDNKTEREIVATESQFKQMMAGAGGRGETNITINLSPTDSQRFLANEQDFIRSLVDASNAENPGGF